MVGYIAQHYQELKRRHYIINARIDTYFFGFSYAKTQHAYLERFGEDFCFVINHADTHDDAYVLPYRAVSGLFSPAHLATNEGRLRWVGTVRDGVVQISPGNHRLSATAYFNAFAYLDREGTTIHPNPEPVSDGDGPDDADLRARIRAFNDRYRAATPLRRQSISEMVARPGTVTDHLKRRCDYTCQLCGEVGFRQANGIPYVEAHHVMELHHRIPGSYCSDNIVIVCATCHRKLHYATVTYSSLDAISVAVRINGDEHRFTRNMLT